MLAAASKLDKASTACDDSERAKKVFQSKAEEDEKRIAGLEKDLKDARDKAETADITYEVGDKTFTELGTICFFSFSTIIERIDHNLYSLFIIYYSLFTPKFI